MSYDPIDDFRSGKRRAFYPSEHESINARSYPGTRQLCSECDQPTGRCEEDSIYLEDETGPLCEECYHQSAEFLAQGGEAVSPEPSSARTMSEAPGSQSSANAPQ